MGDGQTSGPANGVNQNAQDSSRIIPPASVRAALDRVLHSQGFRASRRSQDFLRYVVERTLDGQADTLKERTIGIDVFGRLSGYDPSDDATVRAMVGTLSAEMPELAQHTTSPDAEGSIGRWRSDLDDDLKRASERSFGRALEAFGYEA